MILKQNAAIVGDTLKGCVRLSLFSSINLESNAISRRTSDWHK